MAKSRHQNGYLTVSSKLKVKDATSLFDFLFKVLLIIKYILLVQNKQITLMDIPLLIQYKSDDYTTPSIIPQCAQATDGKTDIVTEQREKQ